MLTVIPNGEEFIGRPNRIASDCVDLELRKKWRAQAGLFLKVI